MNDQDCFKEELKGRVDLFITDPPYAINLDTWDEMKTVSISLESFLKF